MSFYAGKQQLLERLFGTGDLQIADDRITVAGKVYPVLDDVIITLASDQYPDNVARRLGQSRIIRQEKAFSEETQFTFGTQWNKFATLQPEHDREFQEYFDLVDLDALKASDVIDFGCGMGRWSFMISGYCRNIVLTDFSEAIFAARRLLKDKSNAVFLMADIHNLPLADDCADFAFSLGVLHHMPTDCLSEVIGLKRIAKKLLIYLYYALDNRPLYFRILFKMMDAMRRRVGGIRNEMIRDVYIHAMTAFLYMPFIWLAVILRPFKLDHYVPLHTYQGKSFYRVRQDAYDKLLTRVEQRVSRKQIMALQGTEFARITLSDSPPYWHFLCER
jgi:SAM-dependent methyltransferase